MLGTVNSRRTTGDSELKFSAESADEFSVYEKFRRRRDTRPPRGLRPFEERLLIANPEHLHRLKRSLQMSFSILNNIPALRPKTS